MLDYTKRHYHYFIKSINTPLTESKPVEMRQYKAPTLCFDLMEMVGEQVKITRQVNLTKHKFKAVVNEINTTPHIEWMLEEAMDGAELDAEDLIENGMSVARGGTLRTPQNIFLDLIEAFYIKENQY